MKALIIQAGECLSARKQQERKEPKEIVSHQPLSLVVVVVRSYKILILSPPSRCRKSEQFEWQTRGKKYERKKRYEGDTALFFGDSSHAGARAHIFARFN